MLLCRIIGNAGKRKVGPTGKKSEEILLHLVNTAVQRETLRGNNSNNYDLVEFLSEVAPLLHYNLGLSN